MIFKIQFSKSNFLTNTMLQTKLNLKKTPFESDLYLRRRERRNSLPNQMWILK